MTTTPYEGRLGDTPTPPKLPPLDLPKIPGVSPIPLSLEALVPEYVPEADGPGWLDKLRAVWAVLQVLVEHLVLAVEAIHGAGTGPKKKEVVVATAMAWLKETEERVDFIPSWLQWVAFKAMEKALDLLVEKVVKSFQDRGVV